MKLRELLAVCLAGVALTMTAQTHLEGEEYFKADQFGNAQTLLERNLNNAGTNKGISYYYLGRIAQLGGKTAEARKYFDQGMQADPSYPYNYIGKGQIALASGNVKGAQEDFKNAEKLGKKDAGVQVAIARAYYEVNPTLYAKDIDKIMQKAKKTQMSEPEIYIFEGDTYADQKDWGKAGSLYEMAVNYDPKATGAYVKYANLFRQVNPDYSVKMLQALLQETPTSALGQRQLANVYYDKGDFKNAAQHYGNYVNNPNHFKEDEDRYSFLLFYDGQYQKGYDYATNLLKANPDNFSAQRYQFMNAAQIKSLEDQLLPMAESLLANHAKNPTVNKFAPIDYTLIADELNRAKRPEEAVAVLEEGIKTMPTNANFCKQLASIYVDLNDLAKASDAYAMYIEKNGKPDYNDFVQQSIYEYYAGVQNQKDDAAKGAKYFSESTANCKKASELRPDMYKPYKILGDIAIAQADQANRASAAFNDYTKAAELLEKSADPSRYKNDAKNIYIYLGNYYLDQKDKAQAKALFEKSLQFDPSNEGIKKLVETL